MPADADATRQRLIEAAERLFAAESIDGPSLATITREAGLGNTGAIHHHFGDREALLEAVVAQHQVALDARREELLDHAAGDAPSHEVLARILVEPMVAKLDDPRGRAFLRIQAQRTLRPRPRRPVPRPLAQRMFRLLGLPGAPGPLVRLRGELGRDLLYAALAQRAVAEEADGPGAGVGRDEFVAQLCDAVARVIEVPRSVEGSGA